MAFRPNHTQNKPVTDRMVREAVKASKAKGIKGHDLPRVGYTQAYGDAYDEIFGKADKGSKKGGKK